MRKDVQHIEIKEPPLEELKKKRSCLKRSCGTGCGCLVILVVIFLLLLKFVATPIPKELKTLPTDFPAEVTVYDVDNAEYINFISGQKRNRLIEAAAYIPKVVMIPIFISAESYAPQDIQDALKELEGESGWNKFTKLISRPVTHQKDKYEMKWIDLTADAEFVKEYYETELYKHDFKLNISTETPDIKQLTFLHQTKDIEVIVYIKNDPNKAGTEVVILTVVLSQ